MKEIKGDIFKLMKKDFDAFCITTNGVVKKGGDCVMGRGIAYTCKTRWPRLPFVLGDKIRSKGNHVHWIGRYKDGHILSYPVKHRWNEEAVPELIERSAHELMKMIDERGYEKVLLPRPGCGNGKLSWKDVKPIIELILDDRVYVATF